MNVHDTFLYTHMATQTIRSLVSAAEKDYAYWNAIQEKTESIEISRATAFYVKFIEKIINGLNAIYTYHYAEEFVGRFMQRKHFFSLREDEFGKFSRQLADEMVASGNSPNGQYDRQTVITGIQEKARRWYYLLDGIPSRQFRRYKDLIADIVSYDLTTVFYPSNLDRTLLVSYADQFEFIHTPDAVLMALGRKLNREESHLSYLIASRYMQGWEEQSPEYVTELLHDVLKRITHAQRTATDVAKMITRKDMETLLQVNKQERIDQNVYQKAFARTEPLMKGDSISVLNDSDIQQRAEEVFSQLSDIPNFPSNQYDNNSVIAYISEKLRSWRDVLVLYAPSYRYKKTESRIIRTLILHDILHGFEERKSDRLLLQASYNMSIQDRSILLVIAGIALKFSDKFVKFQMFKQSFHDWDELDDMSHVHSKAGDLEPVLHQITKAFTRFKKLPKSQYARLTRAFTSYYTIKKVIELYYENEYAEDYADPEERIDSLYRRYVKKKTTSDAREQVRGLFQRVQRYSKDLDEHDFDEVIYYYMKSDMDIQGQPNLEEYLSHDANREKLQGVIFQRYDEFVFKRIMNRNYAGLANLFGTKGFIILIEAYLIGSGIEYLINHTITYVVSNLSGIFLFIYDLFLSSQVLVFSSYLQAPEKPLTPETYNFSLDAFISGWGMLDWGRTFLSLFIPILFMMFITFYNGFFHMVNRRRSRQKSFHALKHTTKRWINGARHTVHFSSQKNGFFLFEIFRIALLIAEVYAILAFLSFLGFEPTQIGLFFFLLSTICLSAYQGNKLKDEVTLGQSEMITDTIRDMLFIPILEIGRFLSGSAKSVNFIPWLVREGVEPLYKPVVMILQSFITFQKEKKDELL
jgi:hypothetical protein